MDAVNVGVQVFFSLNAALSISRFLLYSSQSSSDKWFWYCIEMSNDDDDNVGHKKEMFPRFVELEGHRRSNDLFQIQL